MTRTEGYVAIYAAALSGAAVELARRCSESEREAVRDVLLDEADKLAQSIQTIDAVRWEVASE